jgi:hypothetical protein
VIAIETITAVSRDAVEAETPTATASAAATLAEDAGNEIGENSLRCPGVTGKV